MRLISQHQQTIEDKSQITTISLKRRTKESLARLGTLSDSYDTTISKLIKNAAIRKGIKGVYE
jgi:hypothetical protein